MATTTFTSVSKRVASAALYYFMDHACFNATRKDRTNKVVQSSLQPETVTALETA